MSPPWLCCLSFFLYTPLILAAPQCGTFDIPFPFYLNAASSSSSLPDAFRLSCNNSSALFLNISSRTYRVLRFFSDGVLVDFPNATLCRHYNDLRSFAFAADQYFAISADNVLDLYDCEDSSLCKPDCERTSLMPSCDGRPAGYPSCCYPLSDRSSWRPGDSLTAFSQYGCRGFSSWVVLPGSSVGMRGVKLEWAVPKNSSGADACAADAILVNATSVANGFRCQCPDGFFGDGFLAGVGCLKSCFKDGKEVHGNDCDQVKHGRKKAIILAGVLTSTLSLVSLTALFLMKRSIGSDKLISEQPHCQGDKARLFTYHELEEATRGFGEGQKIVDSSAASTLYGGVVVGGSRVAVQKVLQCECESESDLLQIMLRLETLSAVSHQNMARIVGWSVNAGSTPLVVYDYPQNGTLLDHLRRARYENVPFDWHRRLGVAAQTASTLAFLHNEISPPVFHRDLHSACIFLDVDFSVRLAGFEVHYTGHDEGSSRRRSDVYSLGLVLLEIVTGNAALDCSTATLHKGKLEEMVDPSLYYHEQPASRREQIQIVVDIATRCLLFGADAKLGMADVARELVHIAKDGVDGGSRRGPALEETFSNSSLLQMISMSPDSIYVPSQTRPDHMYN